MKAWTLRALSSLLAALLLFTACDGNNKPADTEANTESTTVVESESETTVETETETEGTTEGETETETETEPEPVEKMTIGGVPVANFTVVRSPDMPEGQITVLDTFLKYMADVTGVTLPVITSDESAEHEIIIGNNVRENAKVDAAVAKIEDDGYAIVVDGGNLFITASTGRGVAYGVYDFLENYMGVRFYAADFICLRDVGAIVLEEGLEDVFSPQFEARRTWAANLVGEKVIEHILYKNNVGVKKFKLGDTIDIKANSNHTIDDLAGLTSEANVPCLTADNGTYETVLAAVLKKLEKKPETNAVQVGQGDGGKPCACAECKAVNEQYGSENATWFLFINRLADEVALSYPGVKILTYSYQFTHGVPKNGFTVSDNVIIDFCFDDACYQHAFNDPNCAKNAPVAAEFKEWAAICNADNLYVYEYAWNCGDAILPDPNLFVMWDNFQFFVENGANGILSEGIPSRGGDFDQLRYYLRTKLVWNPTMTEEEYYTLMDEFMADYYGDAAPLMRQYLELIFDNERVGCTDMYTPYYTFFQATPHETNTRISEDVVNRGIAIFNEALALETLTEEQYAHVEYTSVHLLFVQFKGCKPKNAKELRQWTERLDELKAKYSIP